MTTSRPTSGHGSSQRAETVSASSYRDARWQGENLGVILGEHRWSVQATPEVADWLRNLEEVDIGSFRQVTAALDMLVLRGPALGRPLVDHIEGSSLANLKELRPGSTGRTELRILFAFDPFRRAILLVAGDKAANWTRWYRTAIPVAEQRFRDHLAGSEGSDK